MQTIAEKQKEAGARAAVLREVDRFHNRNVIWKPSQTKPAAMPDAVGQLVLFTEPKDGGKASA